MGDKKIPFYKNLKDNTHCFQASLKIILKFYLPKQEYSFEELDKMTAKVKGLWTWPMAGILNLSKKNFDVVILDAFDYKRFANEGEHYLFDSFGEEIAQQQIENSDIKQEIEFTKELIKKDITFIKEPSLSEIQKLLDKEYLVICNVDQMKLNNKEGYSGHFVVVYKIDTDYVYFQDPGLPAFENRKETRDHFDKAWSVTKDAYAFKF